MPNYHSNQRHQKTKIQILAEPAMVHATATTGGKSRYTTLTRML